MSKQEERLLTDRKCSTCGNMLINCHAMNPRPESYINGERISRPDMICVYCVNQRMHEEENTRAKTQETERTSFTNTAVTKWMDEYFKARPQLKAPKKAMLGYEVPSSINNVLNSLVGQTQDLKTQETGGDDEALLSIREDVSIRDVMRGIACNLRIKARIMRNGVVIPHSVEHLAKLIDDYLDSTGTFPTEEEVEEYMHGLPWGAATSTEKTMVMGNIRTFFYWIRDRLSNAQESGGER